MKIEQPSIQEILDMFQRSKDNTVGWTENGQIYMVTLGTRLIFSKFRWKKNDTRPGNRIIMDYMCNGLVDFRMVV